MLQPEKVSGEAAEEVAHARAMSGGFRPLSSYFRQADLPYDCGMQEQLCVCCHCQAEMRRPAGEGLLPKDPTLEVAEAIVPNEALAAGVAEAGGAALRRAAPVRAVGVPRLDCPQEALAV